MKRRQPCAIIFMGLFFSVLTFACLHHSPDPAHEAVRTLPAEEQLVEAPATRELRGHPLSYPKTGAFKAPKAVLVAGSADSANFGQEIYWLYAWLQSKGLADDEIACFYARPNFRQYHSDREQFDRLAPFLSRCHAASRRAVLRSIRTAIGGNPPAFFLYVSSHGAPPAKPGSNVKDRRACVSFAPALYLDVREQSCDRLNDLTPESIAAVIPSSNETLKIMVFQGCFSGGFISPTDNAASSPSALAELPNIRIFTASKSHRSSFGCHPGNEATFYGLSFNIAAATEESSLETTDWSAIAAKVKALVEELEEQNGLERSEQSKPQFLAK